MNEPQTTHHPDCWRYHIDCAVRRVEEYSAEAGMLRDLVMELATQAGVSPEDARHRINAIGAEAEESDCKWRIGNV